MNTPLINSDFNSIVPISNAVATPNTILATPFRSQHGDGVSVHSFNTPTSVRTQNGILAATPVRDKLSINPEEGANTGSETPVAQKQIKEQLRVGLSALPTPRNDYEIVVPESDDKDENALTTGDETVEDQADIDARQQQELIEQSSLNFINTT